MLLEHVVLHAREPPLQRPSFPPCCGSPSAQALSRGPAQALPAKAFSGCVGPEPGPRPTLKVLAMLLINAFLLLRPGCVRLVCHGRLCIFPKTLASFSSCPAFLPTLGVFCLFVSAVFSFQPFGGVGGGCGLSFDFLVTERWSPFTRTCWLSLQCLLPPQVFS